MAAQLDVRVEGGEQVRRMLRQYQDPELIRRMRRGTRAGAAVFRKGIRSQARSRSDIPDFFAKTKTRSSTRGGHISTQTGPSSPLFNIFEGGAKSHEIAPGRMGIGGRKMLLSGKAGQRWRKRGFVASMPVRHPGMRARPLAEPVFQGSLGAAKRAVAEAVFGSASLGAFDFGDDGG